MSVQKLLLSFDLAGSLVVGVPSRDVESNDNRTGRNQLTHFKRHCIVLWHRRDTLVLQVGGRVDGILLDKSTERRVGRSSGHAGTAGCRCSRFGEDGSEAVEIRNTRLADVNTHLA